MVTDSERTSNGRLCPFCPVESFEHAQNFPPDGTDINGHHRISFVRWKVLNMLKTSHWMERTSTDITGLETDIKRIQPDTKDEMIFYPFHIR